MAAGVASRHGRVGWAWWPLAVYLTTAKGFTFTVRASFVVFLGVLGLAGLSLKALVLYSQDGLTPTSIDSLDLTQFVSLVVLGVVIHEAGHVVGYLMAGVRWTGVTLRFGASVRREGHLSDSQQIVASALGPIPQALFGGALMAVTPIGSMPWLGGIYSLLDGAANLLMPLTSNMDSTKIYRHSGRILVRFLRPQQEGVR